MLVEQMTALGGDGWGGNGTVKSGVSDTVGKGMSGSREKAEEAASAEMVCT